jgi:NADPH:quinone reductase
MVALTRSDLLTPSSRTPPQRDLDPSQGSWGQLRRARADQGRLQIPKTPPFIIGFEAAGVVVEVGSQVQHVQVGDRVTSIVTSGGYAEYAIAEANAAIPIPAGISFAQATTIPVQGVSAYCLLKYGASLKPTDSVLVQSAAGGVGLYLVQLAKILGVAKVRVMDATHGKGVDVVLEAASGTVGKESLKLAAPFGQIVMYGAKNVHDTLSPETIQQVIYRNQTFRGFDLPSLSLQHIAESIPHLLELTDQKKIQVFKVVLIPNPKDSNSNPTATLRIRDELYSAGRDHAVRSTDD